MKYEAVIGLEVHVQLNTDTKIFCGCSTQFGDEPNSNVCPVCTGMPGALPVLNKSVVDSAIKIGLGLNCKIAEESIFARKQYFYPDSPKNYQISQYDKPTTYDGFITLKNGKKLGITRAHIEEDAGKLIHGHDGSYVDFNRTTTPLIEIVSEPDMRLGGEAYEYLTILKQTLKYLGVSDCNMEEGSLRCDANISVRPEGQKEFGTKAEVKNLNSFKAVQKAIEYEIDRQIDVVENGEKVIQETRLWDEKKEITISMRSKEEAHDYRYFPEPDLPPLLITKEWIEEIKKQMPMLPKERLEQLISRYGLSEYDAEVLTSEKELVDYFEDALKHLKVKVKAKDEAKVKDKARDEAKDEARDEAKAKDEVKDKAKDEVKLAVKLVANWVMVELLGKLNKENKNIVQSPVSSENLAKLVNLIKSNTISGKIAKTVFEDMFENSKDPEIIVKEKNLVQITDTSSIEPVVMEVLEANPNAVSDYKAGKTKIIGFMVGQVMQKTQGKANPGLVNQMLKEKLNE